MVFHDFDAGFYGTGRRCVGLRFVNFFCTVPWVSIEGSVLPYPDTRVSSPPQQYPLADKRLPLGLI
jgi:hypothetical protein